MVRLLALDLDGTLIEPDGRVLPELADALVSIAKRGVWVTTASGRPLEDQLRMLSGSGLGPAVGVPQFIIANEQDIFELKGGRYEPWSEHNVEIKAAWLKVLPRAIDLARTMAEGLKARGIRAEVWEADVAARRGMVVLRFESVNEAKLCEEELKAMLSNDAELQCDRNYRLVQILHRKANKGQTLLALTRALGIPARYVLCIGDAANDLSMLDGRYGFLAAAVGNGEDEVKEAVKVHGGYVASKPRGEGVLEILRVYGLL